MNLFTWWCQRQVAKDEAVISRIAQQYRDSTLGPDYPDPDLTHYCDFRESLLVAEARKRVVAEGYDLDRPWSRRPREI